MGNTLEDLINKQSLILDYLEKNYEFKPIKQTNRKGIIDRWSDNETSIWEINEDLKLFYPFGKEIIDIVVETWINTAGIKRGTGGWALLWVKPTIKSNTEFHGLQFNDEDLRPQNIDEGPLQLQVTYTEEMFWRIRGDRDAETRLVRELAQQFIIEIADDRATRILVDCTTIDRLESTMLHIGFEKVYIMDPMTRGRTIRWVEGERNWHRRRHEYYERRRRESTLEVEMARLEAQRGLIERQAYERMHRAQALAERERRQIEWEQLREQAIFEHGFGRDDNARGYNIF